MAKCRRQQGGHVLSCQPKLIPAGLEQLYLIDFQGGLPPGPTNVVMTRGPMFYVQSAT
jgi:hypothetical protein